MYGTVRTVVWEDGGGNAPSYPIGFAVLGIVPREPVGGRVDKTLHADFQPTHCRRM